MYIKIKPFARVLIIVNHIIDIKHPLEIFYTRSEFYTDTPCVWIQTLVIVKLCYYYINNMLYKTGANPATGRLYYLFIFIILTKNLPIVIYKEDFIYFVVKYYIFKQVLIFIDAWMVMFPEFFPYSPWREGEFRKHN